MYKKAIIFHLVVMAYSITFSSCCETVFTVTDGFNVSFTDLVKEMTLSPSEDTIRSPFIYSLDAEIIGDISNPNDFNLIPTANALSCSEVYTNGYQRETASLVLDKSFILSGSTIPAGTNILELNDHYSAGDYNAQVYEYGIRVWFNSAFVQNAKFPLAEYTFIASVQMADGTIIASQESVVIDIN